MYSNSSFNNYTKYQSCIYSWPFKTIIHNFHDFTNIFESATLKFVRMYLNRWILLFI